MKYELLVDALLSDVTIAQKAGLILKSDLLKVKMKKNEIKINKLKLNNAIDMLSRSMCQHIGVIYNDSIKFYQELKNYKSPFIYFKKANIRISSRKEFQILEDVKTSEILKRKMSKGKLLPQLAVGISGVYLDVIDNKNANMLAFATLSLPISDWWGGNKKIKQHKIKLKIAQNNLNQTSELLVLEMEQNYKKLNEAYQQISLAKISLSQAKEHHRVINDNYTAGILSTSDMLEAQALLQQTKDAETNALCNYKIKLAFYRKSLGLN